MLRGDLGGFGKRTDGGGGGARRQGPWLPGQRRVPWTAPQGNPQRAPPFVETQRLGIPLQPEGRPHARNRPLFHLPQLTPNLRLWAHRPKGRSRQDGRSHCKDRSLWKRKAALAGISRTRPQRPGSPAVPRVLRRFLGTTRLGDGGEPLGSPLCSSGKRHFQARETGSIFAQLSGSLCVHNFRFLESHHLP
jgi:hypothetical protein